MNGGSEILIAGQRCNRITFPQFLFNWPIMMPAQDVTLADSDDWGRVHRLDQLNRKKPANPPSFQ
jgi:hypothetical protein